jgi:large subunit ribosomal protein L25
MSISLNATLRDDMGKGASRRLRHANTLPAIVYGAGKDSVSITLQQKDIQHKLPDESFYSQVLSLSIEGKAEDVLIRDIQHHPYKMEVMHMDFVRVDANKVVHIHSQLHFIGEDVAPGVKSEDGVISHVMIEVELECLPKNIPDHIEIDLSEMHVGDVIHLSDLKMPEGVEVLALKHGEEHDSVVASMHVRKVVEEIEEVAPEAAAEEGGEEEAGEEGGDSE